MFSKFTEDARRVLIGAKKEMNELKHPYVGSEHLLLAMLRDKNSNISKILNKYNLTYTKFKAEIIKVIGKGNTESEWYLYTPLLKKVVEDAMIESRDHNCEVNEEMLFISLIQVGEGIAVRIMLSMNIDLDSILVDFGSQSNSKNKNKKKKLLIDEYGYDMNKSAIQNELDPVIGRDKEIERLIEILCRRTKNNPLLIGDAGVGKTAIVEELARRIVDDNVPGPLKSKRIISVSMSSLVAGTKYRGEFEERITKILKEVEQDKNVIIFIDEIHTLVGAGGAEGAIDASNILKPILARGKLKIIGATTTEEYKKFIENDRALSRRFQTITIEEPTTEKTIEILLKLKPIYEKFHNVVIDDNIIKDIVEMSDKYIYDRKQPDKAIDILDEVSSMVSISEDKNYNAVNLLKLELQDLIDKKNTLIIKQDFTNAAAVRKQELLLESRINKRELKDHKNPKEVKRENVISVINIKSKIPIYELEKNNLTNLNHMKKKMLENIVGQDNIIDSIYKLSKRIKLGFKREKKPMSFLFVGPTGVGKTLMAKKFSELFIGNNSLITIDMSEYKEEHSISKIIGSPPGYVGYSNKSTVIEEIKNKPYSVILLDEIEKAHPSVINLFLQVLDEGRIKDSEGREARLDHNIFIMTSNIGFTKQTIGFNQNDTAIINERLKEYLSPEIINRIDETLIFNKLSLENVKEIINRKIKLLKAFFKEKGIELKVSKQVIDEISKESRFEEYGARRIDKIIKCEIDDLVIDSLLDGKRNLNIQTIH